MHLIRRRGLLRGFGLGVGATLLGPVLSELVREARAQGPAKRFLMLTGHWSYPSRFLMPPRVGSATDFDLPRSMAALEPLRRDATLLTNLYVNGLGTNGGHGVPVSDFLSGTKSIVGCTGGCHHPTSITFDRYLAKAIGGQDRVSSLNLSTSDNPEGRRGSSSYDGPDKAYPPIYDAAEAYRRAFMAGTPASDVDPKVLLAQEKGVLDFVVTDLARAQKRLAGPERQKLDRYAESLRALERKLATSVAPVVCDAAKPPGTGTTSLAKAEAMLDVAVVALACGVTHVALVGMTHENYVPLGAPAIGTANDHIHEINHKNHPFIETVQAWRMGQVARVVNKLRQLGLGDSTLTLYTDANGADHHGGMSSPQFLLMVGGLGGKLRTGQYQTFPRATEMPRGTIAPASGSRATNDVWVAVANAFGVAVDKFGDPAHCRGPLPGLLV